MLGLSRGGNHGVAGAQIAQGLGSLNAECNLLLVGLFAGILDRQHAPVHAKPAGDGGQARDGQDGAAWAVLGYQSGGEAGFGQAEDRRRLDLIRHAHRGLADRLGDDMGRVRRGGLQEAVFGEIRLGVQRQGGHRVDRPHRIFADRRLAREHHGRAAVENGIGNVTGLRPGGLGVVLHRRQHLRRSDHRLAARHRGSDDALLRARDLCQRQLHPQVSACDHDAVGGFDNGIQIGHAGAVLDLCDDGDLDATLGKNFAHPYDIVVRLHERGRDVVDVILRGEAEFANHIITILGTDRGQ